MRVYGGGKEGGPHKTETTCEDTAAKESAQPPACRFHSVSVERMKRYTAVKARWRSMRSSRLQDLSVISVRPAELSVCLCDVFIFKDCKCFLLDCYYGRSIIFVELF